jgi:glycerophosphoryl diester phosphodiesterase
VIDVRGRTSVDANAQRCADGALDPVRDRRSLFRSGLAGLAGLASFTAGCTDGAGTAAEPSSTADARDVQLIAHRGCAGQYPENTTLAVTESAPHVEMIEVDVQRCGSGELVVFHDDELDRLTDATGSVATIDWEALSTLSVLDSGEPIPRLSTVLDAVPNDTAVNVELKGTGMAEGVLSAAAAVDNDVLFSSFSARALRELRDRDPDVPLAYLIVDSPDAGRSIAVDLKCVAIHPHAALVRDTDVLERAHADGLAVNAWTVDDAATARRLVDADVDGLVVDRWDLLSTDDVGAASP